MVRLIHQLGNDKIQKDVKEADFLLSNKKGGYLYMGENPKTKYHGFFIHGGVRQYKTLENIHLPGEVTRVINKFSSVIRERGKATEEFTLPHGYESFIYDLKGYNGELIITMDCRGAYDNEDWGRFYNVIINDNQVIVNFEKQSNYALTFVITGKKIKAEKIREWEPREYELDKARNAESSRYVYKALKLYIEGDTTLVFSSSTEKDKAIEEGSYVFRNINKLKRKQSNSIICKKGIKNKEQRMAYNACLNSLNGLLVDVNGRTGIFAGFPWFFQFWARDELISLKAFGKKSEVKMILMENFKKLQENGQMPARDPGVPQGCADGVGWFYKRFGKKEKLDVMIKAIKDNYAAETGLINNKDKETWMDSISRDGARIEIQAMFLNMLKLAGLKEEEAAFREKVREVFWNGKWLADGAGDWTIRPNVFIAYYIYPELLSNDEWKRCFRNILPKLWCNWGGISTLDKNSKSFFSESTGQNADSYHSGDSWFYLNNMAALAMRQADKKLFAPRIKKMIEASVYEILWMGIAGHHAELSSAKLLRSEGCRCQAWSAAMFVELMGS
ncbi:MAG: amylo-alpha-1,6-glucosidase [Candidatus Woesearchaeota archaeon]